MIGPKLQNLFLVVCENNFFSYVKYGGKIAKKIKGKECDVEMSNILMLKSVIRASS